MHILHRKYKSICVELRARTSKRPRPIRRYVSHDESESVCVFMTVSCICCKQRMRVALSSSSSAVCL